MQQAIFYWEAKRRFDLLTTFRKRIVDYYARARWDRNTNELGGREDAREIRRQINEEMYAVGVAAQAPLATCRSWTTSSISPAFAYHIPSCSITWIQR